MREDINAKFIFFDEGEDPDSYISQKGMDAFNSLLENSIPLSTFFFQRLKNLISSKLRVGRKLQTMQCQ